MGKLVLRQPDGSIREISLVRERMTIGRRADNDICLPFPAVSGEHAAVVTILDDSFLEDLGSTNGTLVNGKVITKHFLRDHDAIDIGRHMLVYFSGDYTLPVQISSLEPMQTVAVTANGGATIGEDEATVVRPARERAFVPDAQAPRVVATDAAWLRAREQVEAASAGATGGSDAELAQPVWSLGQDVVVRTDEPADAPSLEVLDGPSAGRIVMIARDDFVVGRVGEQIATLRRVDDGVRLLLLEGDTPLKLNGVPVDNEGALLVVGDEVEIAGTRVRYRPGL